MTTEQVATINKMRALLRSWPEWMLHNFRVSKAHEDARMEDAERDDAPDGTRVGCWTLHTDHTGNKSWFYTPEGT